MTFAELTPEMIFDATETLGGRCTGRFLQLNAMENRVYDVEMESGERRVIKFYRPGRWKKEQIQAEHHYLKMALENEVPVVPPLNNPDGQTIGEAHGLFFAVFPKKPGRLEAELNPEQLKRLGRYLGRLHLVGESLQGQDRPTLNPDYYARRSIKVLKELDLVPMGLSQKVTMLVDQIADVLDPRFEKLDNILVHGDCHAGNVLWTGDAPHFIDFDDMLYAPAIQDFWMLMGGNDDYAKKNLEIIISGYEEFREFDDDSLKLIEPLRTLRMIYFMAWIGQRWEDGAFKHAFPYFTSERYWQQQVEDLSHQLALLQ